MDLPLKDIYIIEKIIKKRVRLESVEYLVKWKGLSSNDNSWEPEDNIVDKRLIDEFEQRHRGNHTSHKHKLRKKQAGLSLNVSHHQLLEMNQSDATKIHLGANVNCDEETPGCSTDTKIQEGTNGNRDEDTPGCSTPRLIQDHQGSRLLSESVILNESIRKDSTPLVKKQHSHDHKYNVESRRAKQSDIASKRGMEISRTVMHRLHDNNLNPKGTLNKLGKLEETNSTSMSIYPQFTECLPPSGALLTAEGHSNHLTHVLGSCPSRAIILSKDGYSTDISSSSTSNKTLGSLSQQPSKRKVLTKKSVKSVGSIRSTFSAMRPQSLGSHDSPETETSSDDREPKSHQLRKRSVISTKKLLNASAASVRVVKCEAGYDGDISSSITNSSSSC